MSTWSLRQRLTLLVFALITALWVASAAYLYVEARRESQELFDMSIAETADLLLHFSEHEFAEMGSAAYADHPLVRGDGHYLSFQLWDKTGTLKYRSGSAPSEPLAPLDQQGFSWRSTPEGDLRIYNLLHESGEFRILMAEPKQHRLEVISNFLTHLFWFSLFMLPTAFFAVRYVVFRAFAPVRHAVLQVDRIDSGCLQQVDAGGVPSEIQPLLQALNAALGRIAEGMDRERRFTADAAHELRTPLSGLRTNVQLLQRFQDQPLERADIIDDLLSGVDRCSHLITQLLELSRLDAQAETNGPAAAKPGPFLPLLRADFSELLNSKSINFHVEVDGELPSDFALQVQADALWILLRNLVHNAVLYTQPGGEVRVAFNALPGRRVRLSVADDGPGILPEHRDRVFERFYRAAPHASTGSGLGLSICAEIARRYHTHIRVSEGLHGRGVCFSVEFIQLQA